MAITAITVNESDRSKLAMTSEIVTAEFVCNYLKVPRSTLYKLARDKKIPAFRVGRHWRFKKDKIDEWVHQQEKIT
ncbi:MAG: helix-turn-helix domain-containing protein [Candidatus Omnitrophica bacterium]|nr:helix-turn-helix domain-containing protein [Candidatus Omnitrophota bacterium]